MLDRFIEPDGSLNEEALESLKERLEEFGGAQGLSERLEAGIKAGVESGAITQEQADQLLSLLGGASSGASA